MVWQIDFTNTHYWGEDMAALSIERKNIILEKLNREKKVVVSALAKEFSVSEETIRRDLEKLEKEGFAIKSYGGAILNEDNDSEVPFKLRQQSNKSGKMKIAKLVADFISDGEHIFVDPSSTGVSVIKACEDKSGLTILTNSVEILLQLSDREDYNVISTGGTLVPNYLALVGPQCIESIEAFHADVAIVSCKGIDMTKGVTDSNQMLSQVKKKMLGSASKKVLAVDNSKFDKVAFSKICPVTDFDVVVTDEKPAEQWIEYFKEQGVMLLYPEG